MTEGKLYEIVFLCNPRNLSGKVELFTQEVRDTMVYKDKIIAVKTMPLFPAYTTIPLVKAVLLEDSGFLSHVVIIAREFGKTVIRVPKGALDELVGKKIDVDSKNNIMRITDQEGGE